MIGVAGLTTRERPRRRCSLHIASLFSIVIGLVVLVSVGGVLAFSTINARIGLIQGLAEEFDLMLGAIEARVDEHLSAADRQLVYVGDWLVEEPAMRRDNDRLAFALRAAVAATPQVTAIAFMRPDLSSVRIERVGSRVFVDDLAAREDVVAALRQAEARGPDGVRADWSEPLFSPNIGRSIIVRRQAVWDGGRFVGILFAGVDLIALSSYTQDVSANIGHTIFILHGRDRVIAHPSLIEGQFVLTTDRPMPTIRDVGDTRLQDIWREDRRPVISQGRMTRGQGHYFSANDEWQVFVYTETRAYGATPWLMGFHLDSSTGGDEVRRFWFVSAIGAGLLVLFVLIGGWLGRRMSRPFQTLTDNAVAIQRLDLDALKPMEGSRIIELDQAARALDAMIAGLRVFERYVPKRLVETIVREGREKMEAEERPITVIFIDVVGFSRMAETMTPDETAAFLNDHFAHIGACIDAQGGNIDKYIGDGLLAFWGAVEQQEDHADRACVAALAIRRTMTAENERRHAAGLLPIRLRIGIHTGDAIVGDIGAESRINHTAIGDTVNVASRVEQEERQHGQGDVTILVTEDTLGAARHPFTCDPIGPTVLRGRTQPIGLFRLVREV